MSTFMPSLRAALRSYRHHRNHHMAVVALSSMEDAMLKDIGISRSDIHAAVSGRSGRSGRE